MSALASPQTYPLQLVLWDRVAAGGKQKGKEKERGDPRRERRDKARGCNLVVAWGMRVGKEDLNSLFKSPDSVVALHPLQGAPGQMTWLEDPPPWPALSCFASMV